MRNQFTVAVADEASLIFSVNEKIEHDKMKPAGQLIVDSDNAAFVYLMDAEEGYRYVRFEPVVWSHLVKALQQEQDPILQFAGEQVVLQQFFEELQMLVYNIEGNGNYGDDFVAAVEQAFVDILKEA